MAGNNIGPTTGDHLTINAWVIAHVNSTTLSGVVTGTIVDNYIDTTAVTFTAVVSDASNYAVITVAEGVRSKGVAGVGAKLHPTTNTHAINSTNCDYLVVEHLEIHPGNANSNECLRAGAANQTMDSCLCVGRGEDASPYQQDGIHCTNMDATVNVYNSIFVQLSRSGVNAALSTANTITLNLYNNTFMHNGAQTGDGDGVRTGGVAVGTSVSSSALVNWNSYNNIAMDNTSDTQNAAAGDFCIYAEVAGSTITETGSGNITSDTTAQTRFTSTNNLNSAVSTTSTTPGGGVWVVFTTLTAASEDLHIKSSSENEAENGNSSINFYDSTSLFTLDIDGDTRTAALMDGGADQISVTAPAPAAETLFTVSSPLRW